VVTGASSGIGAATARQLAAAGFEVVVGARRQDRLAALAAEIGARAIPLDVTDQASVDAFAAEVGDCAVLVNNAGGARGLSPVSEADDDHPRSTRRSRSRNLWEDRSPEKSCMSARITSRARLRKSSPGAF
jgi:NADP-dependent 3-hydroxy acid dehydrogenase YdfG